MKPMCGSVAGSMADLRDVPSASAYCLGQDTAARSVPVAASRSEAVVGNAKSLIDG